MLITLFSLDAALERAEQCLRHYSNRKQFMAALCEHFYVPEDVAEAVAKALQHGKSRWDWENVPTMLELLVNLRNLGDVFIGEGSLTSFKEVPLE